MSKGLIYYTDFNVDPAIQWICLQQLKKAFNGGVVSVSLNQPLDFGKNIVIKGERSNTMLTRQILAALEASTADVVFFTEHDVLYHPTHFDFTPDKEEIFYYNINSWRWDYPKDRVISYHELTSLSNLCVYRKWALDHYRKRMKRIIDSGWDKEDGIGKMQPHWARMIGYEPGTKRRKIGGFSDDISIKWMGEFPNIDIRHGTTLTKPKTSLDQFKHLPSDWKEKGLDDLRGWDIKKLFNLI